PDGVHQLRAPPVVETDVEDTLAVLRCSSLGAQDSLLHPLRELGTPTADHDADAAIVELVDLPLDCLVEQAHERSDLRAGPSPVLGREHVHTEHFHPETLAGIHDPLHRPHARPVAEAVWAPALASPAPVAVHDDADVAGGRPQAVGRLWRG